MFLTEEEAKEKFCPAPRSLFHACCVGSKCMAWKREVKLFLKDGRERRSWGMPDPDDYEYRRTGKGYCSLAGSPE
jgi:hypothetical protein